MVHDDPNTQPDEPPAAIPDLPLRTAMILLWIAAIGLYLFTAWFYLLLVLEEHSRSLRGLSTDYTSLVIALPIFALLSLAALPAALYSVVTGRNYRIGCPATVLPWLLWFLAFLMWSSV